MLPSPLQFCQAQNREGVGKAATALGKRVKICVYYSQQLHSKLYCIFPAQPPENVESLVSIEVHEVEVHEIQNTGGILIIRIWLNSNIPLN